MFYSPPLGAVLVCPPVGCPSCSIRWIKTRLSPLNSFHKCYRGCSTGDALTSLNVWCHKYHSQLLQDHPPLVPLIRHPGRVNLFSISRRHCMRTHQWRYGRWPEANEQLSSYSCKFQSPCPGCSRGQPILILRGSNTDALSHPLVSDTEALGTL